MDYLSSPLILQLLSSWLWSLEAGPLFVMCMALWSLYRLLHEYVVLCSGLISSESIINCLCSLSGSTAVVVFEGFPASSHLYLYTVGQLSPLQSTAVSNASLTQFLQVQSGLLTFEVQYTDSRTWKRDAAEQSSGTKGCRMWTGAYTISKPGAPAYGIILTMPPLAAKRRAIRAIVAKQIQNPKAATSTWRKTKSIIPHQPTTQRQQGVRWRIYPFLGKATILGAHPVPIQVMHLPKPRKSSSKVLPPPPTVKKRSQILARTRELLSKDCTDVQLLKQFRISAECESSLRAQQADIIDDINISACWLPLVHKDEDGGTIIKKTPWVTVRSLQAKVFQLQLKAYNLLEWNAVIPHDEVWLKIGGDKGGGNFKQMTHCIILKLAFKSTVSSFRSCPAVKNGSE
ncbi:hypothetical protein BSL78_24587 [Apostichopus japonicus]|uniref:Uncharacterized protein n=1 Tax=Stichopus japonicus TaxID=307972 RepID=A0A2G8JS80_STIJA|nr:hypothetical protein BSL78_24587 [Apostichopus japonicus]